MWEIQNVFTSLKNHFNLEKYENFLNEHLDLFIDALNDKIECNLFSKQILRNSFWKLLKSDNMIINKNNLYELLSIVFIRQYIADILKKENKIPHDIYLLIGQWHRYIYDRFIPYVFDVPNDLIWRLCSDFPVPEPDLETSVTLYEEALLDRDNNLKNMLGDSSISTTQRINQFKTEFIKYYGIFENKCKYIEKILANIEGRNAQNAMCDIFQLNNNNDRTPPILVRDTLDILRHLRNSISHNLFTDLHNGQVRIRDKNGRNEWTFDETITIKNLWNFYYHLIILDRMLVSMALFLYFIKRIGNELNFVFTLICGECSYVSKIYLPPPINPFDVIICEKCKFVSFLKHLVPINPINQRK